MTAVALRLTGAAPKPRHWAAVAAVAAAFLAVAAGARGPRGIELLLLGTITGGGLLLDVQLPRGGRVPLGHAVVIALAEIVAPGDMALVMAIALAIAWTGRWSSDGVLSAGKSTVLFAASASAAVGVRALVVELDVAGFSLLNEDPKFILVRVLAAGVAYLAVDLGGRGKLLARADERLSTREVVPVYITLLCASALLAIAYLGSGPLTALVAGVPLLITRFSFERYSEARATYRQTIEALSMIPEVAGLTDLGHGARTAVYANALAQSMKLGSDRIDRITTAAQLHHIGHISLHEPEERRGPLDLKTLAREGAEILQETGFLADVSDLVAEVQNPPTSELSVEAAIVRVASAFDDCVADQPLHIRRAMVEVLGSHPDGVERTVSIALLQLCDSDPSLAERARAAGEPMRRAADFHADDEHDDHSHCV